MDKEKWNEENQKLLALKDKVLDSGRADYTMDEMAEMLRQIYDSAYVLEGRITPLGLSTLSEIQYALRSPESQAAHDKAAQAEIDVLASKAPSGMLDSSYVAYQLLNSDDVPGGATGDRMGKLTEIIGGLSPAAQRHLRIEVTTRSGKSPGRFGEAKGRAGKAKMIGRSRDRGGVEIWAVWTAYLVIVKTCPCGNEHTVVIGEMPVMNENYEYVCPNEKKTEVFTHTTMGLEVSGTAADAIQARPLELNNE